jgi:hypothetical protein
MAFVFFRGAANSAKRNIFFKQKWDLILLLFKEDCPAGI